MLTLQLKSAATDGDVAALERLLRTAGPSDRDDDGHTPLHYAAWCGAEALCRRLLDQKCDVNAVNEDGKTPLHYAAGYGHYDVVRMLLDAGADINRADRSGFTALHQVAEGRWGVTGWEGTGGRPSRHADVTQLLVARGADAALVDTFERTPLDVAGNDNAIRRILNAAQTDRIRRAGNVVEARDLGSASSSSLGNSRPPVESWDRAAVGEWLRSLGLGAYEAVFAEKGITGRYLLTKMTEDKAKKLVTDEFHLDNFLDALADLKQQPSGTAESGASIARTGDLLGPIDGVHIVSAAATPRHTMPTRSVPTGVRSRLTLDNKSTRDVRVYLIDEAGQSQLKQILRPYQTSVIDAVEGQVYQLVDDREGWHLGWIRQLAVATLVSVPDQRTPAEQAGAAGAGMGRGVDEAPPSYDGVAAAQFLSSSSSGKV